MDWGWLPGVLTALVASGAQHILFTGRALQRLDEIARRIEKVEDTKLDHETHTITMDGLVKRLDERIDHLRADLSKAEAEIVLNRGRYHELSNTVQARLK